MHTDWVWDGREFLQFSTQFSLVSGAIDNLYSNIIDRVKFLQSKTSERVQKFLINLLEVVERATLLTVEQREYAHVCK